MKNPILDQIFLFNFPFFPLRFLCFVSFLLVQKKRRIRDTARYYFVCVYVCLFDFGLLCCGFEILPRQQQKKRTSVWYSRTMTHTLEILHETRQDLFVWEGIPVPSSLTFFRCRHFWQLPEKGGFSSVWLKTKEKYARPSAVIRPWERRTPSLFENVFHSLFLYGRFP